MKAEHRKELHTNLLADRMGRLVQGMKTAPRSTSITVWVFVVLALGTLGVWRIAAWSTQSNMSALWRSVDEATHNPDEGRRQLDNIGKQNPGTLPGRAARFELARMQFEEGQTGLTSMFRRTQAIASLKGARDLYGKLAKECADAPLLAQEALMGVAKAEESLVGIADPENLEEKLGSLDRAVEDYRQLSGKFPDSVLGKAAAQRALELEEQRSNVEGFYTELNQILAPRIKTESGKKTESAPKSPSEDQGK